ncbi:MAG: DNA-directed RNA polymerase subunit omega [Candidatus Omnitrophota bacterium]
MYIPLEELIKKTNNSIYKLTIVTGRRAIELAEGAPTLINNKAFAGLRPISLALKEIIEGKVTCKIVK